MKSHDELNETLADANEVNNCMPFGSSMNHIAAKISITQPYEREIAIVFFGQIILLFVENV